MDIVSPPSSVRSFMKAINLLVALTTLVCTQACREKKITVPPFTIDSLMTYSAEGLVTLVDASDLKDSVARNEQGGRTWYTVLMPGTATEALICWMDSTRLQMWEVTVREKHGQPNLWMSRDSICTGLSVSEVDRINGYPFTVQPNGPSSIWGSWGRGVLTQHIATISFDIDSLVMPGPMLSNDSLLHALNFHVLSFSMTRWMLPSQITMIRKPITDPKRHVTTYIPQVVNQYGSPLIDVVLINNTILEWFRLESYDSISPNFSWSNVAFTWEADNGYLALDISGTHLGAHPSDVHETLYFRTRGGTTQMTVNKVPFIAFLNHDQFFPFFKKYWLAECLAMRTKADKCAGTKTTCDCYDNINVSVAGDKINLILERDACFPRAAMDCAPQYTVSMAWDDLRPFLNDFGKKHLRQYFGPGLLTKIDIDQACETGYLPPMIFLKLKNEDLVNFGELPDTFIGLQFNDHFILSGYTEDDEFPGRRPEYLGYDEGPTSFSGTFDSKGFEITIPWKERAPEKLSFTWSQTGAEATLNSFYVDDKRGPVKFMKPTNNAWFTDLIRSASANAEGDDSGSYEGVDGDDSGSYGELELPDEPKVVVCTYEGSDQGDCYHLNFSCGDFVAAETELSEADQALWEDRENYVGRNFQITYRKTEGWPCQAGYPDTSQMTRGDVPLITGFKLQDN